MADPAGTTRVQYDIGNALGALWGIAPRLAVRLTRAHNYAKAVQTYLRAVDFFCLQRGLNPRHVRIETVLHDGRIVQRISG